MHVTYPESAKLNIYACAGSTKSQTQNIHSEVTLRFAQSPHTFTFTIPEALCADSQALTGMPTLYTL